MRTCSVSPGRNDLPGVVCRSCLVLCMALAWARSGTAADANPVGVVSHVKVLSNHVEDVSSPAAWAASYIQTDMTDQDKVLAIWRTVVKYRHQTAPPNEWIRDNVSYVWEKGGQRRSDEHVAAAPQDRYTIRCGDDAVVKSLVVELAR